MSNDSDQRQRALNPQASFIVQAPAGSGKTELLVQRFLVLLTQAQQNPEEIIALTFTRKAAAEMRERVLQALHNSSQPQPLSPHAQQTWQLARLVQQKDQQYAWHLLSNPHRLRIQTIDGLCSHLTRRLPLSSGLGSSTTIVEDANACYLEAARRLMQDLAETKSPALNDLLLHLDNHIPRLENLFTTMLAKRDQWLPHLNSTGVDLPAFKIKLENALAATVVDILEDCDQAFPKALRQEIANLLNFSSSQLTADENSKIRGWQLLADLPPPSLDYLPSWQAIAELLLTGENTWRAAINKNIGFPTTEKIHKQRLMEVLQKLLPCENLRYHLSHLKQAPPIAYSANQWQIIAALAQVLPLLAAHLRLIFQEQSSVDFLEIALAALHGLGDEEQPSDLALRLDYQIRHILVDEFQDTSTTQYRLLEKLTQGWQAGDGRTLFLVGDPMQSIYRFREAEVGLFLKAQREGIGHLPLEYLQLTANFRSDPLIISWINQQFPRLFNHSANISYGTVPYHSSQAMKESVLTAAISLHKFSTDSEVAQEEKIIALIKQALAENPNQSIAVLVRQRSHLQQLIPLLKKAQIAFAATEIAAISQQSIVLDLFALASALLELGDRLSWLAVLRGPCCGLELADLLALSNYSQQKPLFYALQNFSQIPQLSDNGRNRLAHLLPIFTYSIQQRGRHPLRFWLENTWRLLQGPNCLGSKDEQLIANNYFDLLEEWNAKTDISDFQASLHKLRVSESAMDAQVHLMTIHKAKGLEFDYVIIPHLQGQQRAMDAQLLLWQDRPRALHDNDLLLASIKSKNEKSDAIYSYLSRLDKEQSKQELVRLLYVAITRAKKNLHLLGAVKFKDSNAIKPQAGSFLELLWPLFEDLSVEQTVLNSAPSTSQTKILQRISLNDLTNPDLPVSITSALPPLALSSTAAITGTVIHQYLKYLAHQGIEAWTIEKIQSQRPAWETALVQFGLPQNELVHSSKLIETALVNCLSDSRAQWIFNQQHQEQSNEWPLTYLNNNEINHIIIDRSFVADNIRWIIDYKTTALDQEHLEDSLDRQQALYQQQLQSYAQAVQAIDSRQIRLGLYFPLNKAWREWSFTR